MLARLQEHEGHHHVPPHNLRPLQHHLQKGVVEGVLRPITALHAGLHEVRGRVPQQGRHLLCDVVPDPADRRLGTAVVHQHHHGGGQAALQDGLQDAVEEDLGDDVVAVVLGAFEEERAPANERGAHADVKVGILLLLGLDSLDQDLRDGGTGAEEEGQEDELALPLLDELRQHWDRQRGLPTSQLIGVDAVRPADAGGVHRPDRARRVFGEDGLQLRGDLAQVEGRRRPHGPVVRQQDGGARPGPAACHLLGERRETEQRLETLKGLVPRALRRGAHTQPLFFFELGLQALAVCGVPQLDPELCLEEVIGHEPTL
mmetsp:Transcript_16859/g.30164  ORF Transcript_16859/g.30164 Transcript_16859/m.30164 type:complete len:316 (-) Transcript_16859:905-1852(-)